MDTSLYLRGYASTFYTLELCDNPYSGDEHRLTRTVILFVATFQVCLFMAAWAFGA